MALNQKSSNVREENTSFAKNSFSHLPSFNPHPFPENKTIQQLFEEQVEKTPNLTAVIYGNTKLTFKELNEKANRLAHFLRNTYSIKPDMPIGIMVERSERMIIGILAILKSGGAYLPVDPNYPIERIKFLINDSKMQVLLSENQFIPKINKELSGINCINLESDENYTGNSSNPSNINKPNDLVYVIYTSGSTGTPKGVMIEHRSLVNKLHCLQDMYPVHEQDAILQKTTFIFDVSVLELIFPVLYGAKLCFLEPDGEKSPLSIINAIERYQITILNFVPTAFQAFLDFLKLEPTFFDKIKTLKQLSIGGETLSANLANQFNREIFSRLGTRMVNMYGPTEVTIDVTYFDVESTTELKTVPIGKAQYNTGLYILDQNGKIAEPGIEGELYISGAQVGRGYINQETLTNQFFLPDPFVEGQRMYKTGDLCKYLPDGNIEFIGRIDNQVKIRGIRIELGEIEKAVLLFEKIKECVVLATEIEGSLELVVYFVSINNADLKENHYSFPIEELSSFLKTQLPDYVIPSHFVEMQKFPLTQNEKIDRKALPLAKKNLNRSANQHVAPTTENEKTIARIWEEVLSLKNIGLDENFFNLGGHSLLAFKVIYKVNNHFQIDLPLKEFFSNSTIRQLAAHIENLSKEGKTSGENISILPVSRNQLLPLSSAQESLWFISEFTGNSPLYNIPIAFTMRGFLNVEKLSEALNSIFKRHEALRTTFNNIEGVPYQVVNEYSYQNLIVEDVSDISDSRFEELLETEARKTFDLTRKFLIRWKLYKRSEEEHILLINFHHIISDGWSMNIFNKELEHFYNNPEDATELPELKIQYPDYAYWYKKENHERLLKKHLKYWEEKLGKNPKSFELPVDLPRPPIQTFKGGIEEINLSPEVSESLSKFSNQHGKTLFMTLLAAFKILLYRLTNQPDIIVGSPSANRMHSETEDLIGYFVNSMVLRTDLSGNPTFKEVLDRIQKTSIESFEHQEIPFETLVAKLVTQRDTKRSPLFQIMFVLENATEGYLHLDGLKITMNELFTGSAKFDLTLIIEDQNKEINIKAEYNSNLYLPETIRHLLDQYQLILNEILQSPDITISQIHLQQFSEAKSENLQLNQEEFPLLQFKSIAQLFEEQVQRTPDSIAVVFKNQKLTYKELNQKANRLARKIEKQIQNESPLIGILMNRSHELPVTILAILKLGKAYLPLDPQYPEERIKYMIEDSSTSLLIANEVHRDIVEKLAINSVFIESIAEELENESPENLDKFISPASLAYVMYTSGTTGKPNGVEIPQIGINRLVFGNDYFPFGPSHTFLQLAPITFDASTFEIWGALLHGSKLVIYPEKVPSFIELKTVIQTNKITCLWLTASLFNLIIEEDPGIIAGVPYVLTGGEALSVKYITRAQLFNPSTQFINGYGPTESTTFTCCYKIPPVKDLQLKSIPIGKPIANTQVYILDEKMNPVPDGTQGELHIGGLGLAKGYLNNMQLTAEKFVPNPFSEDKNSKLYKSGDICLKLPDGNIEFITRKDSQVKIRGFRIELGEIESRLLNHECISDCVVITKTINGYNQLIAYYTVDAKTNTDKSGKTVSATTKEHLQDYLFKHLPEYMIPNYFVEMKKFPLNENGKIDRKKLPEPNDLIENEELNNGNGISETEKTIRVIWEEVLGKNHITIDQNFFDLGGHSLLATKIIYRVNKVFGEKLLVSALFEAPTIREFAIKVQNNTSLKENGALIQLRPGVGNPIFLFSGIDGNPFTFKGISKYYATDQPLYFIQYPAGNEKQIPYKSLSEYVSTLIPSIKSIQAAGPYSIVGYSLGGRIAFETALQLQESGEKIQNLVMLSALPPVFNISTNPFINLFLTEADIFLKISFSKKITYLRNRFVHFFERFFRKISHSRSEGSLGNVHLFVDVDGDVANYLGLYNLWRTYSIKLKFKGNLLLIRESGLEEDLKYASFYQDTIYPDYHWNKYVEGDVVISRVQINHNQLLEEPNVKAITQIIYNYIEKGTNTNIE
ncbi:MAG TPA: amino acid adenylation domain-containing protein [Bacteroidales bacterium]